MSITAKVNGKRVVITDELQDYLSEVSSQSVFSFCVKLIEECGFTQDQVVARKSMSAKFIHPSYPPLVIAGGGAPGHLILFYIGVKEPPNLFIGEEAQATEDFFITLGETILGFLRSSWVSITNP
jgi:hypothetical protein